MEEIGFLFCSTVQAREKVTLDYQEFKKPYDTHSDIRAYRSSQAVNLHAYQHAHRIKLQAVAQLKATVTSCS